MRFSTPYFPWSLRTHPARQPTVNANPDGRRTSFSITVFLILLLAPLQSASSDVVQVDATNQVGLISNLHIFSTDNVTGSCWTNISAVTNRVRAKLEQGDIATYDEPLFSMIGFNAGLNLQANGMRTDGGLCVTSFEYQVFIRTTQEIGSQELTGSTWQFRHTPIIFQRGMIATSSSNNNEQLLSSADRYTDALITSIYSARRDRNVSEILSTFPHAGDDPMTVREFNELYREYFSDSP